MDEDQYLQLLRRKAQQVRARSPGMESMPTAEAARGAEPQFEARSESAQLEAVIRWYRPVLVVTDDQFVRTDTKPGGDPRFVDPDDVTSRALLEALETNRSRLDAAIRSVGRIELMHNDQFPWVGTGWIIDNELDSDILVTNAHVGREFGMRSGTGFQFRTGTPDFSVRQSAVIDFREELGRAPAREFPVTEIIWISETPGLDMALLRVARTAGGDRIDPPIKIAAAEPSGERMVAVIGFPGSNNGYDPEPFRKLFGPVLGKKRFSPGFYTGLQNGNATYDCSTLPGSSGSVVIDVGTGHAAGLHHSGNAFKTNYAVPAADLVRVFRERPWQGETARVRSGIGDKVTSAGAQPAAGDGGAVTLGADGTLKLAVPLEIAIRLGLPHSAPATWGSRTNRQSAETLAARLGDQLGPEQGVLSVTADYLFRDGTITDDLGVIVAVTPGASLDPADYGLSPELDGVAIAIEHAAPTTIVEKQFGLLEAFSQRRAGYERDLRDPRFDLSPVADDMRITLHVSPEAGWPVLKDFLAGTGCDQLSIGMYHMTAPHVVDAIANIAKRRRLTLTLDRQRGDAANPDDTGGRTKDEDRPERETLKRLKRLGGSRFKWAPASLGSDGLFAQAYHIKAAVWSKRSRGRKINDRMFWLSSGNWQSSNQAPIDKPISEIGELTWEEIADYNREWHAIVEHAGLATRLRNHLEQDYADNAAAAAREAPLPRSVDVLVPEMLLERPRRPREFEVFPPEVIEGEVTVQLLLTPDNYPEVIAGLISRAKERVLIENQSFRLWRDIESTPAHFLAIARAVKDRQKAGLDVRIIFRSGYGGERDTVRKLKSFGLKAGPNHVRYFDKCHTKGIVIDHDIAVLGSQNWTAGGTGPNRDASLVIWHPAANAYLARLFEYDWEQIARNRVRTEARLSEQVRLIPPGAETPDMPGYRRISLAEFLGET